MMAMESEKVTADVVEVAEFPEIAQRYQVMAVPKTVINEAVQFDGAYPEESVIRAVQSALRGDGGAEVE